MKLKLHMLISRGNFRADRLVHSLDCLQTSNLE